ncbi:MAG: acyltransferase family protein [Anaerolineales bacterium]|jgi:surface polysaccharide O-acyltransferase-like enzyme|nr:acyltransferase family protein [Anaerolineales bacterium]
MDYQLTKNEEKTIYPILPWVDFMRFLGAFLVVLAHVDVWGGGPDWAQKLYYTLSRNGVPLFFMMSGYLLLSKEEDTWTFFKKRAAKILVPFLVWSILYDLISTHGFADTGFTLDAVLKMFIRILRGPRAAHLWFFYSLIGLYFFTPILRLFVAKAKESDILYYIALWFLIMPLTFLMEAFTPLKSGFELYYAAGYTGYFLLGLYLGRRQTTPRLLWTAAGLFVFGYLYTFAVFYFDLPPQGNELALRSYPSLDIVLMAIGAFLLVKAAGERLPSWLARLSSLISPNAFGIYLVHSLLMTGMAAAWTSLGFAPGAGPSILVIPPVAVIAFLASWGATALMRKIPILRWTVP